MWFCYLNLQGSVATTVGTRSNDIVASEEWSFKAGTCDFLESSPTPTHWCCGMNQSLQGTRLCVWCHHSQDSSPCVTKGRYWNEKLPG